MLERDDFGVIPMTQEESGLVSEDIWDEMVARLRDEFWTDFAIRVGESGWRGQQLLSRGRHHVPDGYYYASIADDGAPLPDWEKLPLGAVWTYRTYSWYRRESAVSEGKTAAYRMIAMEGRVIDDPALQEV
jgi:hypothetical protein